MAYADRNTSGSRTIAIFIVAIIIAGVGYAFVTGLAMDFAKKVNKNLNVFDVAPPPPPPPPEVPPPPPPPDQHLQPPPVVSPPPIVQTNLRPPVIINTVPTPPPVYIPTPTAPPPSPPAAPPAPPRLSQAATAKGDVGRFFGADAYPPAAQRAEAQGRVGTRITVGIDGRVTDCNVTTSSGNSDLDEATCRIFRSRVRYTPAKDANGSPITQTLNPPSIRWVLPAGD